MFPLLKEMDMNSCGFISGSLGSEQEEALWFARSCWAIWFSSIFTWLAIPFTLEESWVIASFKSNPCVKNSLFCWIYVDTKFSNILSKVEADCSSYCRWILTVGYCLWASDCPLVVDDYGLSYADVDLMIFGSKYFYSCKKNLGDLSIMNYRSWSKGCRATCWENSLLH